MMQQVYTDPGVPQLQVMRKQVSRILQRFTSKRYHLPCLYVEFPALHAFTLHGQPHLCIQSYYLP